MRWFYFHRNGGELRLAGQDEFLPRPEWAVKSENSHTPWERSEDHVDERHVHVEAEDEAAAWAKARAMLAVMAS